MEWANRKTAQAFIGAGTGRVDETSWEEFHAHIGSMIAQATAEGLPAVIDLAGIDYMSSRGLRVLTLAKREAEAARTDLSLARPNDRMREILAISRYDKIFIVLSDLEG